MGAYLIVFLFFIFHFSQGVIIYYNDAYNLNKDFIWTFNHTVADDTSKWDCLPELYNEYGERNCRYYWGDEYTFNLYYNITKDVTEGAKFKVNAKFAGIIPWIFECPVCGGQCVTRVPVFERLLNITMPKCPLKHGSGTAFSITLAMPDANPFKGATLKNKVYLELFDASGTHLFYNKLQFNVYPGLKPDPTTTKPPGLKQEPEEVQDASLPEDFASSVDKFLQFFIPSVNNLFQKRSLS